MLLLLLLLLLLCVLVRAWQRMSLLRFCACWRGAIERIQVLLLLLTMIMMKELRLLLLLLLKMMLVVRLLQNLGVAFRLMVLQRLQRRA